MKNVFIVDDNPLLSSYLVKHLNLAGYDVTTESAGLAAIERLKQCSPDVIFIDYFLPNINGDKLCKIIRGMPHLNEAYIVVMSAAASEMQLDPTQLKSDALIAKGSFKETVKHCLTAIEEASGRQDPEAEKKVKGIETVYSRQMTMELLEQNRHLQTVLDSISEGIMEVYNERIVYANPAATVLLEKPMEKILATFPPDLFEAPANKRIETLIRTQDPAKATIDSKDPIVVNDKMLCVQRLPFSGNENTVLLLITDVTVQIHAEIALRTHKDMLEDLVEKRTAALQQANERFWRAQKMEALGTLAGGLAHDFNNLLMGILGRISLMQADPELARPSVEHLKDVESYVKNATDLTRQLLGFARGGKYEVKPTDLNVLISEQKYMFGRTKKGLTINTELAADLWAGEVDQGQIRQVILNLFLNACQAMNNSGDIFVLTANVTLDEKEALAMDGSPGRFVKITVADTGPGMDAETRQKIFDPFFTTKSMGHGTGLGLASAYGIITNHAGFIDVQSEKDKGTSFHIYLPATTKSVATKTDTADELIHGKGTVLLVDDEQIVIDVSTEMLEMIGYKVVAANGGQNAIELYNRYIKEIDAVILDLIMPGMGGKEVFDELYKINPSVKVILSSGYSIDGLAREILDSGGSAFIQKPFSLKALSQKIQQVLEQQ
jgi:two-component system, cell cycle sensor histidine kinase and response regulator CckA